MKLSEAIRLGSMMGGQAFGCLSNANGDTCALGAAFTAIGRRGFGASFCSFTDCAEFFESAGWVEFSSEKEGACPECHSGRPFRSIVHLNDDHHWSRERIADFVESIEQTIENAQPVAPPLAKVRA